jgi:prophage tail gpP-like protein
MPDNICEVRTRYGKFTDWLSVEVQHSLDKFSYRYFRLVCAEASTIGKLRLMPGQNEGGDAVDYIDIYLDGEPVIIDGILWNRQAAYDANRHAVQLMGVGKGFLAEFSSIDKSGGQYNGYTFEAIANDVLKPLGLTFRVVDPPDGFNEPFRNVVVHTGETHADLLNRLARQRAVWLSTDEKGNYIAIGGGKGAAGSLTYEEGRNILAASCSVNIPWAERIVGNAQAKGSDDKFGRDTAEIQAEGKVQNGIPGTVRKILAEMPLTQKELQMRTDMLTMAIEKIAVEVSVTYKGWKNGEGKLWRLEEKPDITVKSPRLFPIKDGKQTLKLWGYRYSQNAETGTTTTLDLVNERAFGNRAPSVTAPDPYSPSAEPAQPQAPP